MLNRVLLNVRRFKQRTGECSIAAAASLANFFDIRVEYRDLRKLVYQLLPNYVDGDGLYTCEQCRLLNAFGFDAITVVTSDLALVDFSWNRLSKPKLLGKMKKLSAHYGRMHDDNKSAVKDMADWLNDERYDNRVIVDNDYAKYIRRSLNRGCPVGAAINWTAMFKFRKGLSNDGDIKGSPDYHAIVIRGYDAQGVFIVDSHHEFYKGKRRKYRNGYYKVSWEKFLVNSTGDLIIL